MRIELESIDNRRAGPSIAQCRSSLRHRVPSRHSDRFRMHGADPRRNASMERSSQYAAAVSARIEPH